MELPLSSYNDWKVNDKVMSYADLKPQRVEPRLNEIYRKFGQRMKEFENEITQDFNV
jgi:hypothetical protein